MFPAGRVTRVLERATRHFVGTYLEREGEGLVRIDGIVRGSIFGQDVLILGPTAEVRADIDVGTLIVRGGAIWGEVKATRLVELYAPARVYGDIEAPVIVVEEGVLFEGHCKNTKGRSADTMSADRDGISR